MKLPEHLLNFNMVFSVCWLGNKKDICPVSLPVTLVYCDQTVGWIKVPLGMEVGIGTGDVVLPGHPAIPTERGTAAPTFWPMSIVAKRLDGSGCHLVHR